MQRKLVTAKRKSIIETGFPIKDNVLTSVQQELILLDIDDLLSGSWPNKKNPFSAFSDIAAVKSKIEEGEALTETKIKGLNEIYSKESFKQLYR